MPTAPSPAIAVTDTIKLVDADGVVVDTPPRDALVAVQTPQAFRAAVLRAAHAGGARGHRRRRAGRGVRRPGRRGRRRAEQPQDHRARRSRLGARQRLARERRDDERRARRPGLRHPPLQRRPGSGRWCSAASTFAGERGLDGHSDADAVAHAVADALLGAAGLGDIGEHFPDTDERWRGADSLDCSRHVAALVRADAGWTVGNVDCAVVCELPEAGAAARRDAGAAERRGRRARSR